MKMVKTCLFGRLIGQIIKMHMQNQQQHTTLVSRDPTLDRGLSSLTKTASTTHFWNS